MKLRNKKTGEIKELPDGFFCGDNLKKICEEWEDYEEPKEYWYIYADKPQRADCGDILEEDFKAIGNYFDTREEAEKAIEKLKAWKRLKDKGFTTRQWRHTPDMNLSTGSFINIKGFIPEVVKNIKDLDLLFSGEDD